MREECEGIIPRIARSAAVHPLSFVSGDVELGEFASVWPFAVLRGDTERLTVGARSNIQDNAVLHASEGHPVMLGEDVTVGHGAIVHGATVEDCCLIGMGAIVLDGAVIGRGSVVGAGCVIPQGKALPAYSVAVGNPYRILRTGTEEAETELRRNAEHYVRLSESFRCG